MSNLSKLCITIAAGTLLGARFIWPDLTVDAITVGLLIVAALPWLAPLIESFKLPGGTEVKLREMQVAQSKIESLETDLEQIKGLTLAGASSRSGGTRGGGDDDPTSIDTELQGMADAYLAIDHPEWAERVRLKNQAAWEMANYVLTQGVSLELLSGQTHQGLILALAATIHSSPQSGDAKYLFEVAQHAARLNVKYRIVMAIARLSESNFLEPEDVSTAIKILKQYKRRGADSSLRRRIRQTEVVLESVDAD